MQTQTFVPAPASPVSEFTPAMSAWGNPAALGALSLSSLPSWSGYAIAGVALLAAYKRKIPMWAGLAGAGAAWWFLIRNASASASGQTLTSGNVSVSDGTNIVLTTASPGVLSTDGTTLTIAGSVYPVLSAVMSPVDGSYTYFVQTPGS